MDKEMDLNKKTHTSVRSNEDAGSLPAAYNKWKLMFFKILN